MRIVLFGPPGAGKGTQANLLVERLGMSHVTTGGLLRTAIREETDLGLKAREYMTEGRLVPGALVRELAEGALAEQGYDDFILDGYPRTVEQAGWLTDFLNEHEAPLTAVISLKLSDDEVVDRLSKRRIHRESGETYHLDFRPPPPDVDPDLIVQRPDDRPEAIRERLEVYHQQTKPVEDYYSGQSFYHEVNGTGEIQVVHQRIIGILGDAGE